MGLGILSLIKEIAPLTVYVAGVFFFLMAFGGKVRWTLAFVAFLIPLRNVIERMHDFPLGTKFLTILIFAMVIGWLFAGMQQRTKLMERSSLNFIAVVLIFYTFLSLQLGNMRLYEPMFDIGSRRVQDWKNFCMMPLLYFVALNCVQDKKWVWRIFTVMCVAMALMSYYTITQIAWFSSLVSRDKITGTFQFLGVNEVAAFFSQYTMIIMGVYFSIKKGLNKKLLLALIIISMYCILFMFSRAAYLATAVGLFVILAIKNKKLLVPLLLITLFWNVALPEKVQERITQTTDEYGDIADASVTRRLDIWSICLELFAENPVTGIGLGVFSTLGLDLRDPHNIYVELLVEQGIIGLLIFLIICLCFFREGFRLYQKGDDDASRGFGLGLAVCTLVLMINNFFGDRWSYFELSSYLWIFAGLAARLSAIAASQPAAARPAPSKKYRSKRHPKNNV